MYRLTFDPKNKTVIFDLDQKSLQSERAARQALYKTAKHIKETTQKKIRTGTRSGIKYKRLRRRSSAPGEYPANQSGNLAKSIGFNVLSSFRIEVGARVKYAGYLEDGTGKMAPRPYLSQTQLSSEEIIKNIFIKEFNKEFGV